MPKNAENQNRYPAPDGLSPRAAELWRGVVPSRGVSPGRLALIEQALRALDRADEARAVVDRDGLYTTTKTTGAVHIHPAVRLERDMRATFSKLWSGMHLDWSQEDSRIR